MSATERRSLLTSVAVFICSGAAAAATLVVTNTNDSGAGSLRECITVANATPGADTIVFNIPGPGVHTIAPSSPLPSLTDDAGVTIDGYTQPGAHPNSRVIGNDALFTVELSGPPAGPTGIGLDLQSSANTIRGLVINGFDRGVAVQKGRGSKVVGCFVGTDPGGTGARPNRIGIGVVFSGEDPRDPAATTETIIGGSSPVDRNVISGNLQDGIATGIATSNTVIQGNYVGTNANGDAALANENTGVNIVEPGTAVGGTAPGAGNVISGNLGFGVALSFIGADSVQGNLIGTNAAGTGALPNAVGVSVFHSQLNVIGGETPSARNVIAWNRGAGVQIFGFAATKHVVQGNSIRDNAGIGIDLGADGLSPNDAGDTDDGPNHLQNFPVLTSKLSNGGTTMVSGSLNSSPQTTFQVEFFSNDACDPSGFGEGANFLGSTDVATDASGNASFSVSFPVELKVGQVITATATDPDGNTSEFSACQTVTPSGQQFFTVAPCRILDTRMMLNPAGGLPGHSTRIFALAGACEIPPSARSVAANLTVTQVAAPGHLTVRAADIGPPLASTINFSAGQTRANNAILALSMDGSGSIAVENAAAGPVELILDVSGYFE